ncbi:MAG: MbtH domain protein [Alphaproteobacteria bacterium]|nr:MbtH domain protein [Alphaproteobacteria bacterium]
MSELVNKLSTGIHDIEFETRVENLTDVEKRLENGFIYVKFPKTSGGTELGINIDTSATKTANADFKNSKGTIHIEGMCTLDYVKVRCIADIDISTRQGKGCLQIIN